MVLVDDSNAALILIHNGHAKVAESVPVLFLVLLLEMDMQSVFNQRLKATLMNQTFVDEAATRLGVCDVANRTVDPKLLLQNWWTWH